MIYNSKGFSVAKVVFIIIKITSQTKVNIAIQFGCVIYSPSLNILEIYKLALGGRSKNR